MTAGPVALPLWGPLPRVLPSRLFRPESPASYLAVAWLLTFLPALVLSGLISLVAGEVEPPAFPFGSWTVFFLVVVFAPVTETLIMGTVLLVLRRFLPPAAAILLSAAGWGIAHSLQAPAWGLVIWWPFLIFSTVFLVWRERGLFAAFALVSVLHGLHNLIPAVGLLVGEA